MAEILDRQTIKALSIETRQDMMKMLAKRPYTASEIAKITNKHVTTITEHLDVLESSGLVRKRDSTNKWVYYTLTDKGEKLFKPQFYSWVVVLSLSVVLMFTGVLRFADYGIAAPGETYIGADLLMTSQKASEAAGAAPMISANETLSIAQDMPEITNETFAAVSDAALAQPDYVAYALVVLGAAGVIYVIYRKYF